MKNVINIFKVFGKSVSVIMVSAIMVSVYGISYLDVSTMFLFRRLQTDNTVYVCGRSHINKTEPSLEKTQCIRLYRNTRRE